jgi:hypothetical protein
MGGHQLGAEGEPGLAEKVKNMCARNISGYFFSYYVAPFT